MSHKSESLVSVPVVGFVPFASARAHRALATSFRISASVKSAPDKSPTFSISKTDSTGVSETEVPLGTAFACVPVCDFESSASQ